MNQDVRILILEDSPGDAELMERELRRSHLKFSAKRVDTRNDFVRQLTDFAPDLILADYTLPQFDGMRALQLSQETTPLIPVIIVTGSLSEEIAVECMKTGAADYVLKDALVRLGPAVKSALQKKQVQEAKARAENALRRSARQYRLLAENVADGIGIIQKKRLVFVNDALTTILGQPAGQLLGTNPVKLFHKDDQARFSVVFEQRVQHRFHNERQTVCIPGKGREIWIEERHSLIEWEGRPAIIMAVRDITERKLHEMAMEQENARLEKVTTTLGSTVKDRYKLGSLVGKSPAMQEVYENILKAAASEANVFIYGESGTGKDVVAQTIHKLSNRHAQRCVAVNCGAIPDGLFERELFGHQKGAFTGAHKDKQGFFGAAHNGSLFLDEVAELSLNMQVKLLRALENGEYTPIGDTTPRKADARIIAATNKTLEEMVQQGLLREDFFYRIHVITITVPPLRDRKEDILLLVEHFLTMFGSAKTPSDIPGDLIEMLLQYDWPGNVRELQNVLQRYLAGQSVKLGAIRHQQTAQNRAVVEVELNQTAPLLSDALEQLEKELILRTLRQHHGHRSKTAAALGIPRRSLFRKMQQYGLNFPI